MGQAETKFGLNTSTQATCVPTVVAYTYPYSKKKPEYTVGSDALKLMKAKKKGEPDTELTLMKYPYQHGRVMNWDQVEAVYQYAIQNSGAKNSAGCNIVATSDPFVPVSERQELCELLFEKLSAEQVVFEAQGVLNMRRERPDEKVQYAQLSGVGVNSGVSYTSMIPVLNNKPAYDKAARVNLAGSTVSSYLHDLLRQSGFAVEPAQMHRVAEYVKKNRVYCAVDFQHEVQDVFNNPREHLQRVGLSDNGDSLVIAQGEAFKCVEPLFNPELIGNFNSSSLQKALYDVIETNYKSDSDKKALYSNIVLSGGNSLLLQLDERLTAELKEGLRQSQSPFTDELFVNYIDRFAEKETVTGAWQGGKQWTVDASQGLCEINWISKREFADEGKDRIVKKKCY